MNNNKHEYKIVETSQARGPRVAGVVGNTVLVVDGKPLLDFVNEQGKEGWRWIQTFEHQGQMFLVLESQG